MRSLTAILLAALMLPALLLPADLTLCLCELFGKVAPVSSSCCSKPCCAEAPRTTPVVTAAGCGGCKIATLERATVAPSNAKHDLRGDTAVVTTSPAILDETPALPLLRAPRVDAFLRDELRRPPPLLARAQPLLL